MVSAWEGSEMSGEEKPHLSKTQLEMMSRCGMQYYYRYILGKKEPPGVALIRGKAVHKSVEMNLREKVEGRDGLSLDEVQTIAAETFDTEWLGEEPALDLEQKKIGEKAIKARTKDEAVLLSELHFIDVAPRIKPTHVEREFRLVLDGCSHDLKGVIDIQEEFLIRDTKTAARTPPADVAAKSLQLKIYDLAFRHLEDRLLSFLQLDYLVSGTPPLYEVRAYRCNEDDHAQVLYRVAAAVKVLNAGAFMPVDPDHWKCCERYCGFWRDVCPFGRRKSVQI
jgi:hypothetical protein